MRRVYLEKIDTKRNSWIKKLIKRVFYLIYHPIILFGIFFAGYWTAVFLSKRVPASSGAIAAEAILGGFLSVLITHIVIPSFEVFFMEWGAHGYAAKFLAHVLKEHNKDILILAGDLSWLEKDEYKDAKEALKERKGEGVHLLCIDPDYAADCFPHKKPDDIRRRIQILEEDLGLPRKNISYHTQNYRGVLLPDLFALRIGSVWKGREWWLKGIYGSLREPDYMKYHTNHMLVDNLWKVYQDYVHFAPSPVIANK